MSYTTSAGRAVNLKKNATSVQGHDLHALDVLRLVASTAVVFYHYSDYIAVDLWPKLTTPDFGRFRMWVDLFFVISGYVLGHVYSESVGNGFSYRTFLKKRIARLMPLHTVTLAFYVALGLLIFVGIKPDSANRFNWQCLFPNLMLIHAWGVCSAVSFNTPSWSISAEMAMYLLFPVFVYLSRYRKGVALLILAIILIALLEWWSSFPDAQYWLFRASQGGAIRAAPSFLVGLALHTRRDLLLRIPAVRAVAALLGALFIGLLMSSVPYLPILLTGYGWVASMAAIDVQARSGKALAWAAKGGELTYSLYMLHLPVATVAMTLAKRVLHLSSLGTAIWLLLTCGLLWVVATASLRYFEMPARRVISALGTRPPVNVVPE